jgi:hypothetical protein
LPLQQRSERAADLLGTDRLRNVHLDKSPARVRSRTAGSSREKKQGRESLRLTPCYSLLGPAHTKSVRCRMCHGSDT